MPHSGRYNEGRDPESLQISSKSKWSVGSFGVGVAIGGIVGLALFLGLYFGLPPREVSSGGDDKIYPPSSANYENAAVATDAGPCSVIGKDILYKGGSVVDAAIASMLCVGLHNSHSCGIGGGFFMTIYNSTTNRSTFINARETAPKLATMNMYKGDSTLSSLGSLAVGVPGEIAGYWEAHQRFGKLPWKDLFAPSIELTENGYVISSAHAAAIKSYGNYVHNRTFNLWPMFENEDGSLKTEGEIVRLPQLSTTLRKIADEGMKAFYNGSLTSDILQDLEDGFGENIISKEDLLEYKPEVEEAMPVIFDDMTMFVPGPPASGPVLALILNILDGYDLKPADLTGDKKILTYHRIVEAFRFAFAKRSSLGDDRLNKTIAELAQNMTADWYADAIQLKINDAHTWPVDYYEPDFVVPDDSGTSHLSVVDSDGNALSLTSTVNLIFGSKVRGRRTGIIFNNEMDDFSSPNITNYFGLPPSPSNFIVPGNRPLSSMCPSIVVKKVPGTNSNKVKMIAGASGGTKITTGTALVMLNSLYFGFNAGESVEMKRLHDQLIPNVTQWESGFDQNVIMGLREKGHDTEETSSAGSVVQAIVVRDDGKIDAACDSRKGGYPSGY